ncbi:amino acid ABC transporter permease [Modestobacter sp. SYSU DS0511]
MSTSTTVLFDDLGPRGRARVRAATVGGFLLVAAVVAVVLWRLGVNGQLDGQRWAILFDSRTGVPQRLWDGLLNTLEAAGYAMVLAVALGAVLAVGRLSDHRLLRWPCLLIVEFFRAVPLVVLLLFLLLGAPTIGLDVSRLWTLVFGLTLYNMAVLSEIFRAGILSIDRGQSEAAYALGMRKTTVMTTILVPQAVRRMLPALISQLVVLLKDTALGFIIAYPELLQSASNLVNFYGSRYQLQLYAAAVAVYIVVNLLLSLLATRLERRLGRSARSPAGIPEDTDGEPDAVAGLPPARG